ncbi:BamA/TamA family outer membrane protein [Sulfuriroseicoccus oceanibius]|uniref:BamA/TamA family outer membrane protein n=1 Tax=Sulfuriroseicoccus oceanibius TaxID=2707525 RepID=A0A6B3L7W1_9BACT|nr:BamA/TamA family outer membrane protein [Sulfuriroseicoccus oceanibius]QQL43826.1 BamA/TamA family outer membrane protein [Sulfuriroseicoccus oceanibius]
MKPSPLTHTLAALGTAATLTTSLHAQEIYLAQGQSEKEKSTITLPYAFPSETMDLAFGVASATTGGFNQPQSAYGWGVMGSSNSSYGVYFGGLNFNAPGSKRLFVDPLIGASRYTEMRSYQNIPNQIGPFDTKAGSNESDEEDYLTGKGWDVFVDARFRYLLPIGHGKNTTIHTYSMDNGLISDGFTGAEAFNPLTSGRSYIRFAPYYRSKKYSEDTTDALLSATNGLELGLEWDNRDFIASPSRGERFKFLIARDFGWFNSDSTYTTWEFEANKFFSLPETSWARQQVLALSMWTADTPTWSDNADGSVSGRAPEFRSPRLGGFNRMRAFPFDRYNDASAIYYTAEYRIIPQWNPWADINWINNWLEPAWWQIVPFVEIGRVAPSYDLGTLHEDMQWDAGVSLRFMLKKSVVRVDCAVSDESSSVWVMLGQPF